MLPRFENLAENEKEKLLTEHANLLVSPCFELAVLVDGYLREITTSIILT
jgi:hypothetical protein